MAQTLKLKRSAVSGNAPSTGDLALGEIAINTYDGKIFIKKDDGTQSIVTFEAGGSSNAGTIEEDSFTGNGNTTGFTLTTAPSSEENLLVFIDATFQNRDSFTISGTTITFDTAPDTGSSVRVYHVIPGTLDDGILTVAKFAASAIVTEAEGISSNDNDTTIPTSAAVKDYVDTQVATVDTLPEVLANGNTTGGTDISVSSGDNITFADSSKAIFGAGSDLEIFHDGTNSVLNNTTGNLQIYNNADDGDIQFISDNGSGGTAEYLRLDGGATKTIVSKAFQFFDSVKAEFGDSSDLQIWHDGSNSYVSDTGTGSLILTGTDLQLKSAGDEFYMYGAADGQVALYHNGTKKFETTSTGITVIGDIDADDITIDDWGSVSASLSAIQTAGGVNGTGTANTIPKWSDSDTLTDSYLTQPSATTLKLSSDGSATAGTILELHFPNNNTTDRCATINFTNNVGGYAAIEGGTTGANNTGYIGFKVDNAGTQNEAMRIIGSGNVGIGTTSPGKELHVAGEISGSAIQVIGGSSTNKFYSTNTGAIAEFRPSDTRSGMQPIFLYRGTASGTANYMLANGPSTFFGVYDSGVPGDASGMVRITPNNSSEAPAVRIGDAGSNGAYLDVGGNIKLLNNGSSYINGGNVGIGDTGPLTKLHVKVNDTAGTKSNYGKLLVEDTDAQLDLLSTSDGSWGSAINFIEAAGSSANTDVWSIARQTTGGTGDSSLHINFGTNNQHNNANKFKLDTSGNITIPGGLTIGDSNADTAQIGLKHLLGYCENTDVDTGTEDIKSLPLATYQAVFFDYVVKNGTNLRAGTVTAVHDGTNVEFTDTSTKDLGDTSAVTLSVDISGTNMRLRATTTSDNWIVKANIRGIKV